MQSSYPSQSLEDTPQGDAQAEDGTAERTSCDGRHIPDHLLTHEKGRGVTPSTEGPPTGITGQLVGGPSVEGAPSDDDGNDDDNNHHDDGPNRGRSQRAESPRQGARRRQ